MSIALELSRIQTDRNTIRTKLVELGMATGTANLDALATAIDGIINQGAVSVTVKEGETYTIPKGYHNGSGTVSGVAHRGDILRYQGQISADGWHLVEFDGKNGWVSGKYSELYSTDN